MCLCSVPGPGGSVGGGGGGGGGDLTLPLVMMGWMVLALLLFLLRPSSLRGPRPTGKPTGPHNVSVRIHFYTTNNDILNVVPALPGFTLALKTMDSESQRRREFTFIRQKSASRETE